MDQRTWTRRFVPIALLLFALVLAGCFGPPPETGTIHVTSEPAGAEVYLNGQNTGQSTPAVLERVEVGTHEVTVKSLGVVFDAQAVNLKKNDRLQVHFTGERAPAPEPQPDSAVVSGFVNANKGGQAVPGATVTAYDVDTNEAVAETTTSAYGAYHLQLPAGVYDIVATKDEHAQAKLQSLSVGENEAVERNFVMKLFRDPAAGAPEAPTIEVFLQDDEGELYPFEPGAFIDFADLTLGVVRAEAAYDLYRIQVRIGHRDHGADFEEGILRESLSFGLGDLLPPLGFIFDAPGETELIVTVYDYQNNWAELTIPFTYTVSEPDEDDVIELDAVEQPMVLAFTYGQDLGLYREGRHRLFDAFGIDGDPDLFDVGNGTFIDLSRLDKDVTMYTVVVWDPVLYEQDDMSLEVPGYEIQRSYVENRGWQTVAKVGESFGGVYLDFDPGLSPGKPVYYRLRAIGPHDEKGPWSDATSVIPLDRLEVVLVDPADDATNVSLEPTLRWEHTEIGADAYVFHGFVAGVTSVPGGISNYYAWIFEDLINETEVEYNFDGTGQALLPGHTYQWNVVDVEAFANYGPNAQARAFAGTGLAEDGGYAGAANGEFIFTTTLESD